MAASNKKHHKKVVIEDKVMPYDCTEQVTLYARGYKKNKEHGIFRTDQAVDEIACIVCEHRSDDEVITIRYKNGDSQCKDGSDCRVMDFDVYSEIFLTEKEIDSFIVSHLYPKVNKFLR